MHDHGPEADPCHEGKIGDGTGRNDVIDGAGRTLETSSVKMGIKYMQVEHGNGACDTHNDQWLC